MTPGVFRAHGEGLFRFIWVGAPRFLLAHQVRQVRGCRESGLGLGGRPLDSTPGPVSQLAAPPRFLGVHVSTPGSGPCPLSLLPFPRETLQCLPRSRSL